MFLPDQKLPLPRGFTTRFAPAPTGHLHLGHVVNAIWVWGLARAYDGRVLLRIEDHDRGRCRPEYEMSILEDLRWLGFVPDTVVTRQSDRSARYLAQLESLKRAGLAYACDCSRSEIARSTAGTESDGEELRYPGTCRGLSKLGVVARRVVMAPGEESFDDLRLGPQTQSPDRQCGDVLVRDRNANYTYQFAVVVDDLDQRVDLVIRGEDLLASTGRQIRLARLLGRETAPRFLHHPLVMHENGQKLSKSSGDTGIREMRTAGMSASDVLGRAAKLAGVGHDGAPLEVSALHTLFR